MSDRVLIVSSAAPSHKPFTDLTWATMKKYADRHGYDFKADVSDIRARPRTPHWNVPPDDAMIPIRGFIKLDLMLFYLDAAKCKREYDWVVWLDSDMLITNYDVPLSTFLQGHDFVLPFDANGHNATFIGARNVDFVFDFLWACNNAGRTMFLKHDWAEMEAMRYFLQTLPYAGMAKYWSVKQLCAMPPDVYPIPERVRHKYEWTPGDFAIHFSAMDSDNRARFARQYVDELGLL